jgi:hypothetical protein
MYCTKRMLKVETKVKVDSHRKTPVFKYTYGSGYISGREEREMGG